MVEHAPQLQSAQTALDAVKERNPNFERRDHPDRTVTIESGTLTPQPPMSPEAFHEHIGSDPDAAGEELQYEANTSHFSGEPTWHDAVGLLADVARTWPQDGLAGPTPATGATTMLLMRSSTAGRAPRWTR